MRMQFVQNVAIDIEEIAAVGALPDQMKIPDFIEQSARHGCSYRYEARIWRFLELILGGCTTQGKRPGARGRIARLA